MLFMVTMLAVQTLTQTLITNYGLFVVMFMGLISLLNDQNKNNVLYI